MAFADTAKLAVELNLSGNFTKNLTSAEKALGNFDRHVATTGSRAYKAGTQIGTGIKNGALIAAGAIGFLASQVGFGLKSLTELETITTQTNAVLKSTKGAAGQTAASIRNLANEYESLNATIDDKVIQSGENLLLTFTNIRKDAFEPALKAALDMNTALGRGESGLQGTIQQLGVALNDPIKGLTRLQRAGITFTKAQKDAIVAAVAANDTFKAQGIILAELNKRYGGSFLAGGQTTAGKIAKFKDAIDDLQRALATALLPTLSKVADALSSFLRDPAVIKGAQDLGDSLAGLFSSENLAAAGDILRSVFLTAKAAAPVVVEAAKAMAGIISTAVKVFRSLPPEIQSLAIGAFAINKITGGLVTNIAGGLISSVLKQLVSGVVNVNGAVVNVNGGVGGVAGAAGTAAAGAGGLTAGAVATAVAVPVILVGGAALSLKAIGEAADRNNQLAAAGLSFNEIKAYKFYTASQAWQQQALKQGQQQPDKKDFESAVAKLNGATTSSAVATEAAINTAARQGQAQSADIRNAILQDKIATVGKIGALIVGTGVAAARTAAAVRLAGQVAKAGGLAAAAAIHAKKLAVTTNVTVANRVTVNARDVTNAQKTISKYFAVAS